MTGVFKRTALAAFTTPKAIILAAILLPGGLLALAAYILAKNTMNPAPAKPKTDEN